jgi:uncharacterized protein YyaL (SSP411 family)
MAAIALLRLGKLTGRRDFLDAAEKTLRACAALLEQSPRAAGQMLLALDMYLGPTPEIVILGDPRHDDTGAALAALRQRCIPNKVVACRPPGSKASGPLDPLFAGKSLAGREPGVFICEDFACQQPIFGRAAAIAAWDALANQPAARI